MSVRCVDQVIVCLGCGARFPRPWTGRPPHICPTCRRQRRPADLSEAEIEARYQAALVASRAARRFVFEPRDLYRNCAMTPAIDRGPDTERGVNFPEAW